MQEKEREQGTRLAPLHRERRAVEPDLDRAENPVFHPPRPDGVKDGSRSTEQPASAFLQSVVTPSPRRRPQRAASSRCGPSDRLEAAPRGGDCGGDEEQLVGRALRARKLHQTVRKSRATSAGTAGRGFAFAPALTAVASATSPSSSSRTPRSRKRS